MPMPNVQEVKQRSPSELEGLVKLFVDRVRAGITSNPDLLQNIDDDIDVIATFDKELAAAICERLDAMGWSSLEEVRRVSAYIDSFKLFMDDDFVEFRLGNLTHSTQALRRGCDEMAIAVPVRGRISAAAKEQYRAAMRPIVEGWIAEEAAAFDAAKAVRGDRSWLDEQT